jgi:hypothetical protein
MTAEQLIKDVKRAVLEQLKDKLENCDNQEVYFHDIVSNEIDALTPTDRKECIEVIDLSDTSKFDEGVDRSSLDRTLITMAYCSIEDNLFNDDFIQDLQSELNNEKIEKKKAKEIIGKIESELKEMGYKSFSEIYEDNKTQIFINTSFSIGSITIDDFIKYGLKETQIIDLSDSLKILTSNKEINENAIVIEEKRRDVDKKKYLFRVYLMDSDKDIDIRNLFKLKVISKETGFNLSPSAYIEQSTEQYEQDKLSKKKKYLYEFEDKTKFIKHIVRMTNKLTEKSEVLI